METSTLNYRFSLHITPGSLSSPLSRSRKVTLLAWNTLMQKVDLVLSPNSLHSSVSLSESGIVKMKEEMAWLLNSPVVDLNVLHQHIGSNIST